MAPLCDRGSFRAAPQSPFKDTVRKVEVERDEADVRWALLALISLDMASVW